MKNFVTHEGVGAALRSDNLDTDVIIPMDALLSVPRDRLGEYAFQALRYGPDSTEDPAFVLNRPPFRRATVLIAGRNFGSGSSREGAVHAVEGLGIRVVVAPTFGDIFYGNCLKNGILPIALADSAVEAMMNAADAADGALFSVDLPAQKIVDPTGTVHRFAIDPGHKDRLLSGQDEIALTLGYADRIREFQEADRGRRPWIWQLPAAGPALGHHA